MPTTFKILSVLSVLVLVGMSPTKTTTAEISYESPLTITVPDKLDLYIERLAFLESGGRERVDIIDTNGKHSRGCLQFQDATWQRFSQKYGIEADIFNCSAQKMLARKILLHERNGWKHWFTSTTLKGLGKPPLDSL